jgi:hypothetical protein
MTRYDHRGGGGLDWPTLVLASLLLALAAPGGLGAAEPDWRPLFNGRDLTGWTVKSKPADRERVWWRVEDGAIVADSIGHPRHDYIWLMTTEEFGDVALRLEFQAFRDSPGNTGVQIRSRYDDVAGWLDGPQVDIHPAGSWRTGMMWDETRGNQRWLFPAVPRGQWVNETMAPAGLRFHHAGGTPDWNQMEITARGTRVQVTLNGLPVSDYDGAGTLDDAVHRERRVGIRGHIALQIHTGDELRVRFRELRVRPLEPLAPAK